MRGGCWSVASRFDPSAFIQAEDEQTLARLASVASAPASTLKPAENRHSSLLESATLAGIAALAGGGPKTPWNKLLAAFVDTPRPVFVPEEHWDELTAEADAIETRWGETAFDAGWSSVDLYGCPPDPLATRYGQSGLVHLIVGLRAPIRIVGLDRHCAVLRPYKGDDMRFRRSIRTGAVHLWEAYRPTTGP